jgi:hypothetical protein
MKKIEWESTILGNEELFKNLDLWRKHRELQMDEDDNPLGKGFLLSINGSKLYFETDEELVVLLKSYKNAVKTDFAEIERDCIEISTVYGYNTIAEYEIDDENVYKYDWFINYFWERDEVKFIKKLHGWD